MKKWTTSLRRLIFLAATAAKAVLKTVTGNPIHILDALAKPAQALSVALEPIQDLHGYDNPWPAGGGKNKLKLDRTQGTFSDTSWHPQSRVMDTEHYFVGLTRDNYYASGRVTDISVSADEVKVTSISGGYGLVFPVAVSENSQYTFSATFANIYVGFGYYDADWNYLSCSQQYSATTTITTPVDCAYCAICFFSTVNTEGKVTNPQFELGSTATPYSPYSNICPISGHTDADVTRTGKNLFDKSKFQNLATNYEYVEQGYRCKAIQLTPNTVYTVSQSSGIAESTPILLINNKAAVNDTGYFDCRLASHTRTYTTDETGCLYIGTLGSDSATNARIDVCNVQIELGSTASAYSPYVGTTYPIPLGQTVYGGTLDVVTGVLTVTWGANSSLDSKNWSYIAPSESYPYGLFYTNMVGKKFGETNYITSNYKLSSGGFRHDIATFGNGYANTIYIMDSRFNGDVTAFKESLVGQTVAYELAEQITIQLTPQQVELLQGENNIWSDGEMTLVYLADGNASEIEALNILLGGRYVNNHTEDEPTDREALNIILGGNER